MPRPDARFIKSIKVNKKAIKDLAEQANFLMQKVSSGSGTAADLAKLRQISKSRVSLPGRGSLGLLGIGGLAISAYATRKLGADSSPEGRAFLNAVSAAEAGIALGMAKKTLENRNNPIVSIPAKHMASIRAAGDVGSQSLTALGGASAPKAAAVTAKAGAAAPHPAAGM